ncbi:MAG: TetR/AcrR family transcriptional regulator [Alphaproteobacteria bacterium]|nr:TetR/AcrR family transcriptional regulator [Alphaproteobacteria bacterium]MCB9797795.1 TetR/AcrR family transcriptional regulator [Alphaproteobacteria bacterium]
MGSPKTPEVSPVPPKSRAESKAETREALLAAALTLFSEEGLDGPSLQRICSAAGYTRGAFYVHFEDRQELQLAVMERVIDAWTEVIVETAGGGKGDLEATVDRFVATFLRTLADPEADVFLRLGTANIYLLLAAARQDPVVAERLGALLDREAGRLAGVIAAAQRGGRVREDQSARSLADLLVTLVLGVLAMTPVGYPREVLALREAVIHLLAPPQPGA